MVTLLITPFAGIALFAIIVFAVDWLRKRAPRTERFWAVATVLAREGETVVRIGALVEAAPGTGVTYRGELRLR